MTISSGDAISSRDEVSAHECEEAVRRGTCTQIASQTPSPRVPGLGFIASEQPSEPPEGHTTQHAASVLAADADAPPSALVPGAEVGAQVGAEVGAEVGLAHPPLPPRTCSAGGDSAAAASTQRAQGDSLTQQGVSISPTVSISRASSGSGGGLGCRDVDDEDEAASQGAASSFDPGGL